MRELVAVYERVLSVLDARRLVSTRKAPAPGPRGRLLVLGLGKVAAEMCEGARGKAEAVIVVPRDAPAPAGARVLRGGHPLPDEGSLEAGEALLAAVRALGPDDAALLLISGGGSALAEAPWPGLTLSDLREINAALVRSGAPIEEMNCVRAHLSRLKGGGLARALYEAGVRRARALVAVDVPVGGTRAVASGPAAADPTTCEDALRIARTLKLPEAARRVHETLKPGEPADFVAHEAICDLRSPALESGFPIFEAPVRGPVEAFAEKFAALRGSWAASGELELRVPAQAPPGGRDQHLALLMARLLRGDLGASFLAAGTDGRDGNTQAAGAAVDGATWDEAVRRGLEPAKALAGFDSTRVLGALGCLLPARHTGAHAGDLFLMTR
jgi:hydroxypyruvate reductase